MPIDIRYDASPGAQMGAQYGIGQQRGRMRSVKDYAKYRAHQEMIDQRQQAIDQRQAAMDQRQEEFETKRLDEQYGFRYHPRLEKELTEVEDDMIRVVLDEGMFSSETDRQAAMMGLTRRRDKIESLVGRGPDPITPQEQYQASNQWTGGAEGQGTKLIRDPKEGWVRDKEYYAEQAARENARVAQYNIEAARKKRVGDDEEPFHADEKAIWAAVDKIFGRTSGEAQPPTRPLVYQDAQGTHRRDIPLEPETGTPLGPPMEDPFAESFEAERAAAADDPFGTKKFAADRAAAAQQKPGGIPAPRPEDLLPYSRTKKRISPDGKWEWNGTKWVPIGAG